MDDKETISQKLRHWIKESKETVLCPTNIAFEELEIDQEYYIRDVCERKLFGYIADAIDREIEELREQLTAPGGRPIEDVIREIATCDKEDGACAPLKAAIEKYYLPRPLFEDGEPVQWGDEFIDESGENCPITSIAVSISDTVVINCMAKCDSDKVKITSGGRVRRPKPQVLDADGVPIEVGDKIWWIDSDGGLNECTVTGIEPLPSTHQNRYPGADFRINTNPDSWMPNTCITHREPDSLEKLRDDMNTIVQPTEGAYGEFISRLTALIERGA